MSPGDKEQFKKEMTEENAEELSPVEATKFRATVARLNYVCAERPDIQYSVKELARSMATPRKLDVVKLKRLARYLRGRPRLQLPYEWQNDTV